MKDYTAINSYILAQPKDRQALLTEMYLCIKAAAPNATEAIKYGMPTFVGKKNLVHFAIAKNHLGFYPTPSAITHFEKEFSKYKTSKGAVQLPLDAQLPKSLITKVVKFRVKEDQ
jgi:uncharacterized protein YdhG (YjbR/CyaY superfamily)